MDKQAVLVVDDEESILDYLQDLLSSDYRVFLARDTLEAASYLTDEKLALVICDLDMPVLNGVEFISLVRKNMSAERAPILVISAFPDLVKRVDLSLVQGVMCKPFVGAELKQRIAELVSPQHPHAA